MTPNLIRFKPNARFHTRNIPGTFLPLGQTILTKVPAWIPESFPTFPQGWVTWLQEANTTNRSRRLDEAIRYAVH